MTRRTRGTAFLGVVVAGLVAFGAAAFACTNLATLSLSKATGKPGDLVTVTGTSFRVGRGAAPTLPVEVRWNGANATVLGTVTPDATGAFTTQVTIPEGAPGSYVLVATQRKPLTTEQQSAGHNPAGVDEFGTPARVTFSIVGATNPAASPAASPTPVLTTGESTTSGILALTVGLGALGAVLFGAGFVAFARQLRRREVPAPVRK
ncbi:MAG: hypothetical protein ACRD0D_06845 [Acidimicrobiales bacterium]